MKNKLLSLLFLLVSFTVANAQIDSFTVSDPFPTACDTIQLINLSTNYTSLKWEINGGLFYTFSGYPSDSIANAVFLDTACYSITLIVGRGTQYDTIVQSCAIKPPFPKLIKLNGPVIDTIDVFNNYSDPGYSINALCYGLKSQSSYNNVNGNVIGKYINNFFAEYNNGWIDSAERIVHVVDRVNPSISIVGSDTMYMDKYCQFIDPGVTIIDNYWHSPSMAVYSIGTVDSSLLGTYKIQYWVVDGSGNNSGVIERIIIVRNAQAPKLISETVEVEVYNSYSPVYTVHHSCCDVKDIEIFYETNVDTAKLGTYFTNMWLKDCHGNISDTITQTVNIVDRTPPVLIWTGPDTFFIKRYKTLPPDFDTAMHYWDNYDTTLLYNQAIGTYYTTYMISRGPGCYSIIFKAMDKSGNISNEITIWVCTTASSIEENTPLGDLHIYPNPNNGHFTIENKNPNQTIHSVSIFNQMGQMVYVKEIEDQLNPQIKIDFIQPGGLYFIQVQSEKGQTIYKMLVQP